MNPVATHAHAFRAAAEALANVDATTAERIIAAAADIALIIGADDTVLDVSVTAADLLPEQFERWAGKPFLDTVTGESRPKAEALLEAARADAVPRWRQLNHHAITPTGRPVQWALVALPEQRLLAVGRDLAPLASLQQRLVSAQQSMEQDYIRLHQAQMRYRLLFQRSREPVMIVDANTRRVVEANPTTQAILGDIGEGIIGRELKVAFDGASVGAIERMLAETTSSGAIDDVEVTIAYTGRGCRASASLFRDRSEAFFLVRLDPLERAASLAAEPPNRRRLEDVVEQMPDAFVVTDLDGTIQSANNAFLELVQVVGPSQVVGEPLARWLAREGLDMQVMLTNLEAHQSLRLFQTSLKGEYGARNDVEISAVSVEGDSPCAGFTIRNVSRRLAPDSRKLVQTHLPTPVDQLKELVGHVPLKELVRDATDAIERMCIDAALELTNNNRASAAEILGLSRQSLYVKLNRYGLQDNDN